MAQFYLDGGRGSAVSSAFNLFGDIRRGDNENARHKVDTKYKYAEAKRLDALDRYRVEQLRVREQDRLSSAERNMVTQQDAVKFGVSERVRARIQESADQHYSSIQTANRANTKEDRRITKENTDIQNADYASISDALERLNNASLSDPEGGQGVQYQRTAKLLTDRLIAADPQAWAAQYEQTPDDPIDPSSMTVTMTDQGLVHSARTQSGKEVNKTTFGAETADDGTDITASSIQQNTMNNALMLLGITDGKYGPEFLDEYALRKNTNRGGGRPPKASNADEKWPIDRQQAAPATEAAPAATEAVPTAEAAPANEQSATGPDVVTDLAGNEVATNTAMPQSEVERISGVTGWTPQTIEALSELFDRRGEGDGQGTAAAARKTAKLMNEDPNTNATTSVEGRARDMELEQEEAQRANSTPTMLAPATANEPERKGVGLMQQLTSQLTSQPGTQPGTQPVPPQGMTNEQAADFYNTNGNYVAPQERVRSIAAEAPPADRPLIPNSLAGWGADIREDLSGLRDTAQNVVGRMGMSRANAGDLPVQGQAPTPEAAAVAQDVQQRAQDVAAAAAAETPLEEAPSALGKAWDWATKGGDTKRFGEPMSAEKLAAFDADRKMNTDPYNASMTATQEQLDAVKIESMSSPYTGGLRNEAPADEPVDDFRRSMIAQAYRRRGGANAEGDALAALEGEYMSLNEQTAKGQRAARQYHQRDAIEQAEGVIDKNGNRVPAPVRDTVGQSFLYHMGVDVDSMREAGFNAKDEAQLTHIKKELKREGIDLDTNSTVDLTKLVQRVFSSNEATMKRYTAEMGQDTTNVAKWSKAERQELIRRVVSDITAPGGWDKFVIGMKRIPIARWWNGKPPGGIPGPSKESRNQRAKHMGGEGIPQYEKGNVGLRALQENLNK